MGGYGALRIALAYPDRYVSANSHSGGLTIASRPTQPTRFPDLNLVFGPKPIGTDHDLLHLARKVRSARRLPHLRIDCGLEDHLLSESRQFHETLLKLKIPHEYEEFPGGHNWDYWEVHVREALAFHKKCLGSR